MKIHPVIRATAVDLLVHVACAALYLFKQSRFDPKKSEDSPHTPILLVHGYLHNSSAWTFFRHKLKASGYKNIFTLDLGYPFLSIQDYAYKLSNRIEEIQSITGRNDIQLIGHSMGGIVSSYYALYIAKEQSEIKSIITLGSPLEGTKRRGIGECTRQMRYQSNFIKELNEQIYNSSIPYFHVGTKSDLLIIPQTSAIITKNQHVMFDDLGHLSLIFSDRVVNSCLDFYDSLYARR